MAERDDEDVPPPPRAPGRGREVWIGLFVLVGFLGGLGLLFSLTDPAMFRGRYFIHTVVEDAGGIRKNDPVRMVGVVIGRVLNFKIDPGNGKVAMRLEVESEYTIPKDSRLEIRSKNFWGEMVAEVVPGRSAEVLQDGDSIPGKLAAGMLSGSGTEDIAANAQDVMNRLQRVMSDETIKSLNAGAGELQSLLNELDAMAKEQRKELVVISKSLRKSAQGLESAATRPELQEAIKKTDALMVRLDEASQSLGRSSSSLERVMARLEKGEGNLGKLLKDEDLYKNLNRTVENMNKLVVDLREHPRRYVKLSLF